MPGLRRGNLQHRRGRAPVHRLPHRRHLERGIFGLHLQRGLLPDFGDVLRRVPTQRLLERRRRELRLQLRFLPGRRGQLRGVPDVPFHQCTTWMPGRSRRLVLGMPGVPVQHCVRRLLHLWRVHNQQLPRLPRGPAQHRRLRDRLHQLLGLPGGDLRGLRRHYAMRPVRPVQRG